MDWTGIVTACISAATAVVVAVVTTKITKDQKDQEKQAARRKEESLLGLRLSNANCALTIGVAMALKHGHCNGEVEEGLQKVKSAQDEYLLFEQRILAEELSK